MNSIKRIAVLTSGGDAPGMNAAVRAVTRCALTQGWDVLGVQRGYAGLVEGRMEPLSGRTVSNIMQRGGTVLGSARCPEFESEEVRWEAVRQLRQNRVDALVVIGGNGSQTGALALEKMGFPVVGVASTIDNDLAGSEVTIGVDTALNIALEAIDRLKTTASSHQRAFLVEVMGRKCGYLALMAGLAGGAEIVLIPERETPPEEVARQLRAAYEHGKRHALAVVAEGAKYNASKLDAWFQAHSERIGFDLRTTTLGHVQRGGTPSAFDRLLGTRFGAGAVEALMNGKRGILVGLKEGKISTTSLAEVVGVRKSIDPELFQLASVLDQ